MPLIERRYAEALIGVGLKNNSLDLLQSDLNQVDEIINSNSELKKFLNNPVVDTQDKRTVIEKLFGKSLGANTLNFLKLLIDKDRIRNIAGIIYQYIVLADKIRECLNIKVITSTEIPKSQLNMIGEKFKKMYGSKEIKINHVVDESIIGGVIVKIGDKMIDGSVKGKIDGMLSAVR